MLQPAIFEESDIGRSGTYVYKGGPHIAVLDAQGRLGRGDRMQDKVRHLKSRLFTTVISRCSGSPEAVIILTIDSSPEPGIREGLLFPAPRQLKSVGRTWRICFPEGMDVKPAAWMTFSMSDCDTFFPLTAIEELPAVTCIWLPDMLTRASLIETADCWHVAVSDPYTEEAESTLITTPFLIPAEGEDVIERISMPSSVISATTTLILEVPASMPVIKGPLFFLFSRHVFLSHPLPLSYRSFYVWLLSV